MPAMPFPFGTYSTVFFTKSGMFTADISRRPSPSRTWTVPATAPTSFRRLLNHTSVSLAIGFSELRKKDGDSGVQFGHQRRRQGEIAFAAEALEIGGACMNDRRRQIRLGSFERMRRRHERQL